MKFFAIGKTLYLIAIIVFQTFVFSSYKLLAQSKDWKPVSAEELQMTRPKVEPGADAEAIFWDVYVSDEDTGGSYQTVLSHYLKIKIFNDRGRETFSKIDIPFGKIDGGGFDIRIKDIAARTTKKDGTVVELKGSDIFDRDVVKGNGIKIKSKSFAVPGIEPGAVIEYRWKEIRGAISFYQRLQLSREILVELVVYHVKPVPAPEVVLHGQTFNAQNQPFKKESNGFYMTSATNIPSFQEEPRMPPENSVRPWMLLYYTKDLNVEPEKYWKDYGRGEYDTHKAMIKVSDEVKAAATEAVGSETDPEKKVQKIFDYVRAKIKNVYDDRFNLTADDIKKIKENKNSVDTIKRGEGSGHDINVLFAAMAAAAGLDARIANLPRKSDIIFPKWFTDHYFMRTENVAIKLGTVWRFFDPASRYSTYGMLSWEEEGQPVLVSDSKEPTWQTTQLSPSAKSLEKRTGKFKLLDDGTLEGNATIEFTGHLAAYHKEYNDDDTPQQRENTLKQLVRQNILGSADVSDISIENVSDPDSPFRYIFKIRVPGYATRTGKRLFFQPNVFERSSKPMFEKPDRKQEIYFEFSYAEQDDITIDLPAGYELESPDVPSVVKDESSIGVDDISIGVSRDKKSIVYTRNFSWGNGLLRFPKETYPALKKLFEAFNQANIHTLTLKQTAASAVVSNQ
ncbi:hypothetical protein BH10ACI2_BH10ACI2_11590 [soil metagenome]